MILDNKATKKVNIMARSRTITALPVHIRGFVPNATITVEDIFKCICQKGEVDEIMPDGSLIRLDLQNYKTDHISNFDSKNKEDSERIVRLTEEKRLADDEEVKRIAFEEHQKEIRAKEEEEKLAAEKKAKEEEEAAKLAAENIELAKNKFKNLKNKQLEDSGN